jgi:hypothetical protein
MELFENKKNIVDNIKYPLSQNIRNTILNMIQIQIFDFRITMITANASSSLINSSNNHIYDISFKLDLDKIFEHIQINDVIKFAVSAGNKNSKIISKGTPYKEKKNIKKVGNQLSLEIHFQNKIVDIKIFKNGKFTIANLKHYTDHFTKNIIQYISNIINYIHIQYNVISFDNKDIEHNKILIIYTPNSFLINSIMSVSKFPFSIRRDKLYSILLHEYDFNVSYNPESYSAIKLYFFYNDFKDGICRCTPKCKPKTKKVKKCNIITLAIFHKCCNISGSLSPYNTMIAYSTIYNIIINNFEIIQKKNMID